ncbi:zinc finger protein 845 [Dunckerocampus dactyliophorus]|uniref:zinc finger protein 845 n=1 Tax=Dunckerocampus dactyliophorus TaxID=161453 RepID=UPI002405A8B3|nr:zinc finger protein 845 [Dunckerocampus dactyliophorus]XP_054636965.1 zinc finger protein 845 [Dunckerocampus dactyliophorus]XP_054636966.1 zinc finger protein 845 [Dunckerocampus dactyliophorus]XP_054636967.1 zinc finger protein 845 [Dunckerocampus dactyliophorus]XP_054636968.1 zinc finger protein 845 [Dunckerocampus dactyliophorus]XP_054636969.1 zinc finger protein 845 [Dunckerocampus dactyliophorus]XP_054636970.1 zinc finger protein 845 [Dunckerocampus dactyliophorus]XP_054636971.1 zin
MRGGNMAAISPPESPKRPNSLAEDVHTSGSRLDAVHLNGNSHQTEERTFNKPGVSQYSQLSANVGNDSASFPSHSEVSEPGAEGDQTFNSLEDGASEPKMAESPGGELRPFDSSETEDDDDDGGGGEVSHSHKEENNNETTQSVLQETLDEAHPDAEEVHEKENSCVDQQSLEREPRESQVEDVDVVEDHDMADKGQDADLTSKPKKSRFECKECGKCFTRRETFYLHRHYHAHKDELVPLTCKECGLSFSDRRSLIKHRHEHEEREEPKYEEKRGFQCAECEKTFSSVRKLRSHKCINSDDKPYRCTVCRQEFQYRLSVTKHILNHSKEDSVKCEVCGQTFPDYRIMRVHQRRHPDLKPFECPECGMVFKYHSIMEDHRRKHTNKQPSHLCNICGKTFKYSSLFQQHQYLHTGEKAFNCPECGKKFAFAQNMKAHCRQHRLHQTNTLPSTEQPTKQTTVSAPVPVQALQRKENAHQSEEPKRTFNCPLCPQTCSTPANLRAHMLIHEMEYETLERSTQPSPEVKKVWDKGHTCPHCPCTYRDEISLRLHILRAHKYVAQDSDKMAAVAPKELRPVIGENALTKFRNEGLAIRPYKCSECGKTFRHRSVLDLHMRIHSKDKPYQCKVCGKGFRFSSYLQQHLIIHSGKKPHKCPDCGKDFAFLQNMRTHQKLHQEKPFRCTSCRKGYSDELQLQHHMLSHNGEKPHKCHLCEKSFGLAYLLRDHMNTHTGERPHHCGECNKSFSWLSSLLVHQKIHSRKRQSQGHSFSTAGRMRGRGNRGGRPTWGMSRLLGGPPLDADLHRELDTVSQSSMISSCEELQVRMRKEALLSDRQRTPVQWKVDGEEVMPVQSSRHSQMFDSPPLERSPQAYAQKKSSPLRVTEQSGLKATTSYGSLQRNSAGPSSFMDGAVLWSVRPPLLSQGLQSPRWSGALVSTQTQETLTQAISLTVNQPEASQMDVESQKQRASALAGVPTAAQIDQSSLMPLSTPVSQGVVGALWDIQAPLGISGKMNSPEKQAGVATAAWTNVQNQTATQQLPISIHPFGQGIGTAVWGFQNNPALLTGQLKPRSTQELRQQTLAVTGSQIVLNQPTPFFSPPLTPLSALALSGAHPLHAVAVNALQRPPHPNIFFTPQAVMTERPPMPQTLPLPQLSSQTEAHKLGVSRLPFAPDRLLQCMICGCSLPRELDLQMHYLQHAQGEI